MCDSSSTLHPGGTVDDGDDDEFIYTLNLK
jgi:hypothetical protein